jgi:hypothetical protein
MLNGQNNHLILRPVEPIIDEIRISSSDELPNILK